MSRSESLAGLALTDGLSGVASVAGAAVQDGRVPAESLVGAAVPDGRVPAESLAGAAVPCGAAELLRRGGPVRVPLRECCVAALIGVKAQTSGCVALAAMPADTVASESPAPTGVR